MAAPSPFEKNIREMTDQIKLAMLEAEGGPCVVCGKPSDLVCMSQPSAETARKMGTLEGKTIGVFVYCVCMDDDPGRAMLPESVVAREEAIVKALAAGMP